MAPPARQQRPRPGPGRQGQLRHHPAGARPAVSGIAERVLGPGPHREAGTRLGHERGAPRPGRDAEGRRHARHHLRTSNARSSDDPHGRTRSPQRIY